MRVWVIAASVLLLGCSPVQVSFSSEEAAAVRDLEESYRSAWLANDSAAVMANLSPDAILMPAGVEPLVGGPAIRAYWWPDDGSSTTVTDYDIVIDELVGSGDLAYIRGHATLGFTYRDSTGATSNLTSRSAHLSIAQRSPDGQWRIVRRAWSALR